MTTSKRMTISEKAQYKKNQAKNILAMGGLDTQEVEAALKEKEAALNSCAKNTFLKVTDECMTYVKENMNIPFTDPLYGLKSLKEAVEKLSTETDSYSFGEALEFAHKFYSAGIPYFCEEELYNAAHLEYLFGISAADDIAFCRS